MNEVASVDAGAGSRRGGTDRTPGPGAVRSAEPGAVALILADLSGYTAYLAASEPDRAPAIVADLVETVVRCLRPVARLDKLEGDAALMVASLHGLAGERIISLLAKTLATFDRRMRSLVASTACACAACAGIPGLDLSSSSTSATWCGIASPAGSS